MRPAGANRKRRLHRRWSPPLESLRRAAKESQEHRATSKPRLTDLRAANSGTTAKPGP
jgi:hypothetical protein